MSGRSFRAERRALGKTQQDVADAAGVRRQTIVELEAGRNVSLHTNANSVVGNFMAMVAYGDAPDPTAAATGNA